MGQLIIAHSTLHVVTSPIAIAVFLGLAIYVITCNPRRPISWVFSMLCLTVASIYTTELFLTSKPAAILSFSHLLTRWKWAALILSATFYLQLAFYYFPPTWQRFRFRILASLYLLAAGLVLIGLFTDLLVDGHFYHSIPHLIDPKLGWFFITFYAGFFTLALITSAAGLLRSYYASHAPSFCRQLVYLLVTTVLVLAGTTLHWITILRENAHSTMHLLPDAVLILAAVLYAQVVITYGSFVGRPLARRSLFYSTLATIAGGGAVYLTVILDQWLMNHTPLPYYLFTGIFVLMVATGLPPLNPWITTHLDQWLFPKECQQQKLARCLAEVLAEAPDPVHLQAELLEIFRRILNVDAGYVAVARPDLAKEELAVQIKQGDLPLQPGNLIRRPPLYNQEPQLVAALLPQASLEPSWQGVALFCPLPLGNILALGEKRDKTSFTLADLLFCTELVKQLDSLGLARWRLVQREPDYQAGRLQKQLLQQLTTAATRPASLSLTAGESSLAPLEIRVLGPLQVRRYGQLIPEAAWGSEKAKGMLAYLIWKSPAGVTREELCEALWPGRSADETANVFHVTLHRLRRVLRAEPGQKDLNYILHDRGYYRFNLEASPWLDVVAFESLVIGDNPAALQAGVDLYRGAYLEDMAWVLPIEVEAQRQRLEQFYAGALRCLAAQTDEREKLIYLEKLLAIEPADEITHRALVLGHLARGRGDLARRQIERWQQALADFGLETAAETKLFWQTAKVGGKQG